MITINIIYWRRASDYHNNIRACLWVYSISLFMSFTLKQTLTLKLYIACFTNWKREPTYMSSSRSTFLVLRSLQSLWNNHIRTCSGPLMVFAALRRSHIIFRQRCCPRGRVELRSPGRWFAAVHFCVRPRLQLSLGLVRKLPVTWVEGGGGQLMVTQFQPQK